MCSSHQPEAGADSAPIARQGRDGQAHLTYFDTRSQASFVWDGRSNTIEVSLGGYSEPVDHTIRPPEVHYAGIGLIEAMQAFTEFCQMHAATLPDYGVPAGEPC